MYAFYPSSPPVPYNRTDTNASSAQKPVVCLLLLPPAAPSTTSVPLLRLPEGYRPTPDPWTPVKKYTGRTLDRVIGYCWWLLTMLGAGSALFGLSNVLFGLGAWRWWGSRATEPPIHLP